MEENGLPWRYSWGDFIALSYVWGDPSVKREIYIGESSVLVRVNLEAALRQLRNHSRVQEGFRIWIDALCINQADLVERAVQVLRMKDIYARAWRVVVWLGPKAKNSDLAMMAIRFLSIQSQEKEPLHSIYHRFDRYINGPRAGGDGDTEEVHNHAHSVLPGMKKDDILVVFDNSSIGASPLSRPVS